MQDALRARYGAEDGLARLDAGRRDLLRRELDWFGALALAPAGSAERPAVMEPARRAVRFILVIGAALLALGATGLVGLVVHVVLARKLRIRWRLAPGRAPGGIYAETFAAWFVLFMVLSFGASYLSSVLAGGLSPLLLSAAGMTGSLAALGWPVLRGVPWDQVRDDLGLRLSPTPFQDLLVGAYCWVSSIPAIFLAALVTFVLFGIQSGLREPPGPFDPVTPPHPLGPELVRGNAWILALFAASVVAPVVEETFFRGALYRHLREATGSSRRLDGALLSGLISSFIFAVIHPQGLAAVPVLMAVALPLWWSREWRGSLLAPMAAHSLHNAVVTLVGVAQFRS